MGRSSGFAASQLIAELRQRSYARAAEMNPVVQVESVSPPVVPVAGAYLQARPEDELSLNLQIALLSLAPDGSKAKAVFWKLKGQDGIPVPMLSDFQALAGKCLATRPTLSRYHQLTHSGCNAADQVAKQIATARGIHAFYAGGNDRYSSKVWCCCGWSAPYSRTNQRMSMARINAENSHLTTVERMAGLATALVPPETKTEA